jgi:hypothetical protein
MAMDYRAATLLESIRRRGALPSATAAGCADSDLLALTNEELQSWLVPLIMELREDYFIQRNTQTTVAGTAEYRIPPRAVAGKLREVDIVTSSGAVRNLARISLDELEEWPQGGTGTPAAFYVSGNNVVLVPTPSGAETLRLTYYLRPSQVVADSYMITDITGDDLTVSNGAGEFFSGGWLDIVAFRSPFDVKHVELDIAAANISGLDVILTVTDLPADIELFDYAANYETTPIPNAPAEFHPLLAQRVVCKVLEQMGQGNRLQMAQARLSEMVDQARRTYAPRVDGESKILSPNSHSLMGDLDRWGGW